VHVALEAGRAVGQRELLAFGVHPAVGTSRSKRCPFQTHPRAGGGAKRCSAACCLATGLRTHVCTYVCVYIVAIGAYTYSYALIYRCTHPPTSPIHRSPAAGPCSPSGAASPAGVGIAPAAAPCCLHWTRDSVPSPGQPGHPAHPGVP